MRNLLAQAEERFGKLMPLNTVGKLHAVLRTQDSSEETLWVLNGIFHLVTSLALTSGEVSMTMLTGKGRGRGGLVDLLLFKRTLWESEVVQLVLCHQSC